MRHFQSDFRIFSVHSPQYVINYPVTEHSPLHSNLFCQNGHASGDANNMHPISRGHKRKGSQFHLFKLHCTSNMCLHRLIIAALSSQTAILQFKLGLLQFKVTGLYCCSAFSHISTFSRQ